MADHSPICTLASKPRSLPPSQCVQLFPRNLLSGPLTCTLTPQKSQTNHDPQTSSFFHLCCLSDDHAPTFTHTLVCTRILGIHLVSLFQLSISKQTWRPAGISHVHPSRQSLLPYCPGTGLICILLGLPQGPPGLPASSLHLCCKVLFLPQKSDHVTDLHSIFSGAP